MSVSVGKVVSQTNAKIIAGGQDIINTARLVGVVDAFATSYSVANIAALPPAVDNTGRFIYVEDIAAYRYSDGTQWTNDYDTTLSILSTQLWGWGNGSCGQLGDGTTVNKCSPVREFCSATDWCKVDLGRVHGAAVKASGQLWTWGDNICGKLGDGTTIIKCSPVREISSSTDWCQVSASRYNTAAIKTSGQLWAWGSSSNGRLANGNPFSSRCSPVREICSATDWCQVDFGRYSGVAIKTTGQIWVWGSGVCGMLGDGTTVDRCSPVREFCSATDWCRVSMYLHTAAIKTSGQLWVWGCNGSGRLGDGTITFRCSPIREFCSATDWCQVSARCSTAAIKTSGELWSWGSNDFNQLGDGTATSRCSPVREISSSTDWCLVAAGDIHSAAIKTSGQLWSWGYNGCGRLGDGTITQRCSPVREISSSTDWCLATASLNSTSAIKINTRGFNEP